VAHDAILGWKTERVGGKLRLTQLRILESIEEPDGDFAVKTVNRSAFSNPVNGLCGAKSRLMTTTVGQPSKTAPPLSPKSRSCRSIESSAPPRWRKVCAASVRDESQRQLEPSFSAGLKQIERQRRRARDPANRWAAGLEAIAAVAQTGLKDHNRWLTARTVFGVKLKDHRSTSRLPT
jgi:hypothetical protein